MKRHLFLHAAALALLFCGTAAAQTDSASGEVMKKCQPPAKPEIPNGRTATEEQMVKANKAVKEYLAASEEYIACLHKVEASWGDQATEEQRAVIVIFHNRQVDEMHATGDLFNQAVRAYKGR
jgi:hypothetical protein